MPFLLLETGAFLRLTTGGKIILEETTDWSEESEIVTTWTEETETASSWTEESEQTTNWTEQ